MSFWNEKFGETTLTVKGGVTVLTKNKEVVATTENFPLKKGWVEKALSLAEKIPLGVIKNEHSEEVGDKEKTEENKVDNPAPVPPIETTPTEVTTPESSSTEPTPVIESPTQVSNDAIIVEQSEENSERTKVPTVTEVVIEAKVG